MDGEDIKGYGYGLLKTDGKEMKNNKDRIRDIMVVITVDDIKHGSTTGMDRKEKIPNLSCKGSGTIKKKNETKRGYEDDI